MAEKYILIGGPMDGEVLTGARAPSDETTHLKIVPPDADENAPEVYIYDLYPMDDYGRWQLRFREKV